MANFITDNVVTRNYTLRLWLCSVLLTLSSANFAFDNQGFGQTQAMDAFAKRFGEPVPGKAGKYQLPATFLSYSNAFPFILLVFGIGLGSMISSKFGRRMTVFTMSLWAMICVPIIVTSKGRSQFLGARCLNSIYIGMEMSCIPVYQSEIVPARVRGLAVASYQMSFAVGGFVMSAICHRTATIKNDWAWKIPFLCYLIVPGFVASLIWFQPESPRWLVSKGRIDQARINLSKFRKADHDVEHELEQMILGVEAEKKRGQGSYKSCFQGGNLRRTFIVLGVNFFLQATGQAYTSLYGPVIIKDIGSINPFNYTLIIQGLTMFMYIVNLLINDVVGRRPLMIISAIVQAVCMYVIAGAGTVPQAERSASINAVLVTFIIVFSLGFAFGWAPLSYLLSAELPSQELRDKTTRMGFAVGVIMQFLVAFTLPYLRSPKYANLDMKVGFIYAPIATVAAVWAYFFIPECKGLRLEQIDQLFEEGISARRSARWTAAHAHKDLITDARGNILDAETDPVDRVSSNDKPSIDHVDYVHHNQRS